MANNCYFEMKIAGKPEAVKEFIQMMQWKGPYEQGGLGRVFSFDLPEPVSEAEKDPNTGTIAVTGMGDCAWSVKSAMIDWRPLNLTDVTERLGLAVEVFSSEPGCCFQEHYLINKGEYVEEECVDYEEHWLVDAEESYVQQVAEDHNLTREELMAQLNENGDFCVGGFDNFGCFENLFSYFEPVRKPALVSRIAVIEGNRPEKEAQITPVRSEDRGRDS